MTKQDKVDFDELVFEKRNKFYGAYFLRKKYDEHLLSSLFIGVTLMASVVAIPYLSAYFGNEKSVVQVDDGTPPPTVTVITDVIFDAPKPKPEMAQGSTSGSQAATLANRTLVIGSQADPDLPTPEDLRNIQPGANTGTGGDDPYGLPGGGDGGIGGDDGGGDDDGGYTVVPEIQPVFPGGEGELQKFLQKNIIYPERAKNMGIEGTVYVQFVVDEFGNVRFAEIARGIGGGCDEEALRVVKKMPRWHPARQAGHPVKVRFYLPISYALN